MLKVNIYKLSEGERIVKKIINYILLSLTFIVSTGQIVFVLLDGKFDAQIYDKIAVVVECVPLAFLPIVSIILSKNKQNCLTSKIVLSIELFLFLPLVLMRIQNIIKNQNNLDSVFASSIVDTAIIIMMLLMILFLMYNKKKLYKISLWGTVLLGKVAIVMNLLTINNAVVLNAVIIIVLYALSIYPFYVLQPKKKGDWNESY